MYHSCKRQYHIQKMQNDHQDINHTQLLNSSALASLAYSIDPDDQNSIAEDDFHDQSQSGASQPDQPSLEQIQSLYYAKGLEELESLQLLDLSPLASWKLSSHKQGCGLAQLRDDTPSSYWQSDGSTDNNMEQQSNAEGTQLNHPHTVTLLFSKRVSLERISLFTNFQLDESYTPLKIKIMAGSSNWDLAEVCVVNFEKPIGWSHIIFKGVRGDALLKCFVVKIVVLANHQDGKDSHIRAIRCFGKKTGTSFIDAGDNFFRDSSIHGLSRNSANSGSANGSINHGSSTHGNSIHGATINGMSGMSGISGILLNNIGPKLGSPQWHGAALPLEIFEDEEFSDNDPSTAKILTNVADVIGFNSGFDTLELQSVSSIR